jgi:hypothetical protein
LLGPNSIPGVVSSAYFARCGAKNYALFWSSDLIASVGQFVREVALYWLAYKITGSAWALAILGFCEAAPRLLLLSAVGGVIVDQYDRLSLLTGIQILCCLPVLGLIVLYFLGITAWSLRRHADYLPHREPVDHSGR